MTLATIQDPATTAPAAAPLRAGASAGVSAGAWAGGFPGAPASASAGPLASPPVAAERWPPERLPADPPLFIVLNPGSGSGNTDEACAQIAEVLHGAGRPHHLRRVDRQHRLDTLVAQAVADAQREHGVVVAAGGDGTLNTVAQAAHAAGCLFGVIPQGTFNYFAREHGIPTDPREATEALLRARPTPVQVGEVNGRIFLVNASLGLYPRSLQDREALKRRWGRHRVVALGAALRTLLRGMHPLRVRLQQVGDDRYPPEEALRLATLFVGNNRLQLAQLGLAEAGALDDGRLAAVLVRPLPRRSLLWLLIRGALGALSDASGVRHLAFDELTVSPAGAGRRWRLSTDGELHWMTTPIRFCTAARPLWLMLPPAADDDAAADQ
jgi:diacylglycerol kinase family enzyme